MKKIVLALSFLLPLLAFAQPSNDACSNAITLYPVPDYGCTGSVPRTLQNATATTGLDACAGTADDDVWFTFTATSGRHIINISNITGATTSIVTQVFQGGCNGSPLSCASTPVHALNNLTIGTVYHIRAYSFIPTTGLNINFNICISTPGPSITTSGTQYTASGLVNDVLLNGTGVEATNITSSTGTNFGSANGLGYFTDGGTAFPLQNGVILSTGDINNAMGPNTTVQGGGANGWPGDADVLETIQQISTGTVTANDATVLEFDFVSPSDYMSIDYVFASEEYGDFQCNYSDSFVIMLIDMMTGVEMQLAVVPNTTLPVSAVTVRNSLYNNGCSSVNASYFGAYYPHGNTTAPINFNGRTIVMSAQTPLIPNYPYHLKIAIADRNDHAYDSALFVKGIHFTTPPAIGTPEDLSACDQNNDNVATFNLLSNNELILNGLDPEEYAVVYFETFLDAENNSNAIENPAEYTNVLWGTEIYARLSSMVEDTFAVASFAINVLPTPEAGEPAPINIIDTNIDGQVVIDLTSAEPEIFNGQAMQNFSVTYHSTQQDASNGENELQMVQSYTTGSGTVYFRLENNDTGCYDTGVIQINVLPMGYVTPAPVIVQPQQFTEYQILEEIDIVGQNILWYATATGGEPLSPDMMIEEGATYYASQTLYGIESTERASVTIDMLVEAPDAPTGEAEQYFYAGATIQDLVVVGSNIVWYSSPDATNSLSPDTLLEDGYPYYASQTVNSIESVDRLEVTAILTSPPPAAEPEQNVADGDTLADLEVDGENVQWYDTPGLNMPGPPNTLDTALPMSTLLVDGETYYASQTIDGIESVQRTAVTVHMTMGTDESTFSGLRYFPNPVKDVLHLSNTKELGSVEVYNTIGQLVMSTEVTGNIATINFEALGKGVYLVKLKSGTAEKTIKIMKQ